MKAKEIKELSIEEIQQKLRSSREELFKLRMRKQMGQIENPSQLRVLRRTIARIETIIKEKKRLPQSASK